MFSIRMSRFLSTIQRSTPNQNYRSPDLERSLKLIEDPKNYTKNPNLIVDAFKDLRFVRYNTYKKNPKLLGSSNLLINLLDEISVEKAICLIKSIAKLEIYNNDL